MWGDSFVMSSANKYIYYNIFFGVLNIIVVFRLSLLGTAYRMTWDWPTAGVGERAGVATRHDLLKSSPDLGHPSRSDD